MDAALPAAPAFASQVSASPESAPRGVPERSALLTGRKALLPRSCACLAQPSPARLPPTPLVAGRAEEGARRRSRAFGDAPVGSAHRAGKSLM